MEPVLSGAIALPPLLPFLSICGRGSRISRAQLPAPRCARRRSRLLSLIALRLVFWADQAWVMSDAILRTCTVWAFRGAISWNGPRRRTSKIDAIVHAVGALPAHVRRLLWTWLVVLLLIRGRTVPPIALPFLLAWLCAPMVARSSAGPRRRQREPLSGRRAHRLRVMARQTWSFFDTFVTAEQNMLPPDNFQEIRRMP
jgi:cyclic beta-1,2-glucan synthetase